MPIDKTKRIERLMSIKDDSDLAILKAVEEIEEEYSSLDGLYKELKSLIENNASKDELSSSEIKISSNIEAKISEINDKISSEITSIKSLINETVDKINALEPGYTPIKGKDYMTESDIGDIVMRIKKDMPTNKSIEDIVMSLMPEIPEEKDTSKIALEASKIVLDEINPRIKESDTPEKIKTKLELLKGNNRLDASAIKNLPQTQFFGAGVPGIDVLDEGNLIGKILRMNFAGDGVSLSSIGNDTVVVTIAGGATNPYTETPTGDINGVNVSYAVLHDINTIYSFAINGQFIHPDEYTVSGNIITFNTPLDSSLSGKSFTIIYA